MHSTCRLPPRQILRSPGHRDYLRRFYYQQREQVSLLLSLSSICLGSTSSHREPGFSASFPATNRPHQGRTGWGGRRCSRDGLREPQRIAPGHFAVPRLSGAWMRGVGQLAELAVFRENGFERGRAVLLSQGHCSPRWAPRPRLCPSVQTIPPVGATEVPWAQQGAGSNCTPTGETEA